MQTKSSEYNSHYPSPLHLLEDLFLQFDWHYENTSDTEIMAEVEGRWCLYRLFATWHQDLECLLINALFDIKVPLAKKPYVEALLSAMNPKVWLGHFEVTEGDIPTFRYNLTLRATMGATPEQLEEILLAAVVECDRLYPALQFVLWGGKSPEEALMAAMLETHGEA
jgi:hypothetical protein